MKKLRLAIVDLLSQGMTPEKIALTLALGVVLGVAPVLGTTTLLCSGAAIALRLNLPLINLINYLAYPLQIVLVLPFIRAGEWLFAAPPLSLTPDKLLTLVRDDTLYAITFLWYATMQALVAWLLIGAASTAVVYFALLPVLRRLAPVIGPTEDPIT